MQILVSTLPIQLRAACATQLIHTTNCQTNKQCNKRFQKGHGNVSLQKSPFLHIWRLFNMLLDNVWIPNAPIAESAANNETCKFKATAVGAYPRFEASLFSFVLPFFSLLLLPLIWWTRLLCADKTSLSWWTGLGINLLGMRDRQHCRRSICSYFNWLW